ncbi:hypothetical protein LW858_30045 (plasmid) [Bacillus cereus]|nr:hypothetical protein [Bacillus cereus]UIJ69768.1 hypothetical protein LW858_30045 [Bacillus cereus]
MKKIIKWISLFSISFFMMANTGSAQGLVNVTPTDRTVFSEPYYLGNYS